VYRELQRRLLVQADPHQTELQTLKIMKLLALFALAASLVLTGCGGGGESAPAPATTPAATNAPAK
jgi:hypothetical protein